MSDTSQWTMLLHHLDSASAFAEELELTELQGRIDDLARQAKQLEVELASRPAKR